jgi:hypothetical protein
VVTAIKVEIVEKEIVKPSEQVYWLKTVGAVLTGGVCMYLEAFIGLEEGLTVLVGIAIYIALSEVLAILTKVDRNRTLRIGIGAFLFLWILVWTLLNTLFLIG